MEERMYLLMAKMLSNEDSGEERRELNDWLEASANNRAAFEEVRELWQKTEHAIPEPQFDARTAWHKVALRTVNAGPAITELPQTGRHSKARPMRTWWTISAAAAGLLLVALVYTFMGRAGSVTRTATDSMLAITLPDQSRVHLKPGSTLTYPERFEGSEREVSLEGDAFFEVTRNEQQPFIVQAQAAQVRVLGTSFNVSCSDTAASVAVRTGKVQMSLNKDPGQKVVLTRGNKGIYESNTLVTTADTNYTYYSSGELNVNGLSLEQGIAIIGKVKNTTIEFDKNVGTASRQQILTIRFKNATLVQMLDELCLITGMKWRKEQKRYVIYAQ